jgi:hypothetical protein
MRERERNVGSCMKRRQWYIFLVMGLTLALSSCTARYVRPEVRLVSVSDFRCENEAVGRQAADIMRLILNDKGYRVEPESYDLHDNMEAGNGRDSSNMRVTGEITSFNCEANDRQVTRVSHLSGATSSRIVSVQTIEKNKCDVGVKIRFVDVNSGKTVWSADIQDRRQGSKELTSYRVLRDMLYRLGGHIPRGL